MPDTRLDVIFAIGLLLGENHRDDPLPDRLPEADEEIRLFAGIVAGDQLTGLTIDQPDRAFTASRLGKGVFQQGKRTRINQADQLRWAARSDPGLEVTLHLRGGFAEARESEELGVDH